MVRKKLSELEEKAKDWEFLCLGIDNASKDIVYHFDHNFPVPVSYVPISGKKYVSKANLVNFIESSISDAVKNSSKPTLTLYGSGHYHHYTYALCRVFAKRRSKNFGYIHFDHHHDMWKDSDTKDTKQLNCGCFVKSIKRDAAQSILTIGADNKSYNQLPYRLLDKDPLVYLKKELEKLPQDVYLSFDLDVMRPSEIATDWPYGRLSKKVLFELIDNIKEQKNLIGVDILGFDLNQTIVYRHGMMRGKSMQLYEDVVKKIIE